MIGNEKKFILMSIKIFLIALASILVFYIFGKNNLIIGIGAINIAVTMFGEDYTSDITTTTILLATINVLIGVFAYIASLNSFLGLIVTFFISFIIYYLFSYDAKPSKSIGFILTYLMLLYYPIQLNDMPLRLLALAFSGIVIMFLYCILSKYNFDAVVNKEIINVIDLILTDEPINDKNKSVNIKLKNIELKIYERMENSKKDLESVYIKEIIIALLIKINTNLPILKRKENNIILLENTQKMLEDIKLYILNETSLEKLKDNLKYYYNSLETYKITDNIDEYNYYNLKASIEETHKCIEDMDDIKSLYINERIKLLKLIKENLYGLKNNIKMTSLRFNIAIKASILISLSVFIVNYFNIYRGQWTIYTIVILLFPNTEFDKKKAKDRVIGTIIGCILFNIINFIINGNVVFMVILMLICAYLSMVIVPYTIRCIFITFNAILGIKIIYPNNMAFGLILTEYRVLFTLIGAVVTAIIMNMFFPYKLKYAIKNTIIDYIDLNQSILNELEQDEIDKNKLELMLLTNNYLWRRINYNNKQLKCDDIENLLSEQNNFIIDVSFLLKTSKYLDNNATFVKSISKKFNTNIDDEDFENKAKEIFNSLSSDTEKLIMIHMYKIYSDVKNINLLGKKIILKL